MIEDTHREYIKAIIARQGARITSVKFIKKDGTERTMLVQVRAGELRVTGARSTDETALRAARHPHLYNVWDMDHQAFRSINLDTVIEIRGDSKVLFSKEISAHE